MRSGPPGAATTGRRRDVFCAALEQAEELLGAAARVGNPVRPLPLFYGLSQAGRAVAACASALNDQSEEWWLSGHGLSTSVAGKDTVRAPTLADVLLKPRPGGVRLLQTALASPHWQRPIRLGAVWAAIPDDLRALPGTERDAPAARLNDYDGQPSWDGRPVGAISSEEMRLGIGPIPETLLPEGSEEAAVQAVLSAYYPGWKRTQPIGPPPGTGHQPIRRLSGGVFLTRTLQVKPGDAWSTLAASLGIDLSQGRVIPALEREGAPSHPFILWWALLFGLSMRARYEPEGWARDLDVDHSHIAVPLEEALETALRICPGLIVRVVDEASGE